MMKDQKQPRIPWTDERVAWLREVWPTDMAMVDMSAHLGISRDAIKTMACRLGLYARGVPDRRNKALNRPSFNKALDLVIDENCPLMEAAQRVGIEKRTMSERWNRLVGELGWQAR